MTVERVPVLIVGAGAGGLVTAAVLAQHGVRSLLVEKRREVFLYPKARNLSFRSLEILRGLGLADEVHAIADGVSAVLSKPTLNSPEQRRALDVEAIFSPFDGLSPEPPGQYCPQSAFEPILLAYIRGHGCQVRYDTELCSFSQDSHGVEAALRQPDSGAPRIVRADYLVAADGVHSPIREALGVTTSGYGALPIYVVFVYFRAPWRKFVPALGDGDAVQVGDGDVNGIFMPVRDDFGMFIATYLPANGETAERFTADYCRELIVKSVGEPIDVEVVDVAPWQPYERVADRFQSGRVFLVGDSAHTMPPFKAGGANTAIQSAHNLAWKLAAVLGGAADRALLGSYHAERHPVGRFNARQSLTGPSLPLLRPGDDGPRLPADEEAPMFNLLIGYRYGSDGLELVDELRGQPGTRCPHVWVRDGVSTLDLLGPRFTVLTGDERWCAAAASVSVAAHRVRGEEWANATGLADTGALLVRPDDFVGWRAEELSADPEAELRQALSQILCRSPFSREQTQNRTP
ncbi:FAD-binding protein [Mycobacterium alsense]|uniref:FAD-dependent monooxygenase n=1 Tax=Mycobacterium alsense TaxID=324058 RepID=UPI0007FE2C1D|nr:FAD-dependent monooxygenase [Mycobacterium alsense]OBJ05427.1 FAD-binding protein [Mycobacterium alsense]